MNNETQYCTISSLLNADLIRAVAEAGSYVPEGPASKLADEALGYKIDDDNDDASSPTSPSSTCNEQVQEIIHRLLKAPQSLPTSKRFISLELALAMQCFGSAFSEHMVYDSAINRVRLKEDSEVRLRGAELGLPKQYLRWLCAEEGYRQTWLRIRPKVLQAGERTFEEATR